MVRHSKSDFPIVKNAGALRAPRVASQRQRRVAEEIKRSLSDIFTRGEISDPELSRWTITITQILLSPDLKEAKIYVLPLAAELDPEKTKELAIILNKLAPEIRHHLAQTIELRYVPALKFFRDDTFEQAQRIEDLIRKTMEHDKRLKDISDDEN